MADDLFELVILKQLSNALTKRIRRNYRRIVGLNTGLILLEIGAIIQPTTSAMLHNTFALAIGMCKAEEHAESIVKLAQQLHRKTPYNASYGAAYKVYIKFV